MLGREDKSLSPFFVLNSMASKQLVFIKKGGQEVTYIHSEKLSELFSGEKDAPKVSHVRFDKDKQEWFAILRDGREITRGENRDIVVSEEARIISEMFARREYIPGGFHAEPLDLLKRFEITMPEYFRCVGKVGEWYHLYVSEKNDNVAVLSFFIDHCDILTLDETDLIKTNPPLSRQCRPKTAHDKNAIEVAIYRLDTERKIAIEEYKKHANQ